MPKGELLRGAILAPPCWPVKRDSTWVTVLRASCLAALLSAAVGGGVVVGDRSRGESVCP